ncbi:MAG: DMT family transporter [Bacteroidota bacterium]
MSTKIASPLSLLMAATGVVLFSTKAVMVKLAYPYGVDHVSLLVLRMAFALPIYLLIDIFLSKKPEGVTLGKRDYVGVLIAGIVGYYLASLFDFQGLLYISASLERLILFTYPTIVILISRFFLKEQITTKQYLGIGITYLGMLVIFLPRLFIEPDADFWLGAGLVFLSALTYAFFLVTSGKYIPRFGTIRFTAWSLSISAFCVLVHFALTNESSILEQSEEVYYLGGAMAVFATVIPSFLISGAIKRMGASNMSIIGSLGPVSTIVLAIIFLGETLDWYQLIGAVIVISGVVWVSFYEKSHPK